MTRKVIAATLIAGLCLTGLAQVALAEDSTGLVPGGFDFNIANVLAWLAPIGLILLAIGACAPEQAEEVATTGFVALGMAAVIYLIWGFALQFGGVGLISSEPGLERLTAEWSPLDVEWGLGWGMIGLRGFLLLGQSDTPGAYGLFFSHLPWVVSASLIPLLAVAGRLRRWQSALAVLLTAGLIYPLFGNWIWGGGWLANLGRNLSLGHGTVDMAGAGGIHLLGALLSTMALGLWVPRRESLLRPARMPPVHFPLFMILGALCSLIGFMALSLSTPWSLPTLSASIIVNNLILAAAGGALASASYAWFVAKQANALMTARGMVAGLVAASGGCGLMPGWVALVLGVIAGLLVPPAVYLVERILRWDDRTASIATHGIPGVIGMLAVGILADGRWGAGWNGVGVTEYLGVPGQGVSGFLTAVGYQPGGPEQFYAQVVGVVALLVLACGLPWLIAKGLELVERVQQGPALEGEASKQSKSASSGGR
ncbi:MAG: hypothetical protein H5T64_01835 [Chloroflexi bacterium]|nr:hypothetical protein [Chloroflexota bacterium]